MRLDYLDFLRCVAAIAVFAQHLLERADPARFRPFLELGPGIFGVALFFLISGFVIPHSVRRGFAPADFAVRRLFRVFPAYLTVLAAVVALGALGLQPWRGTLVADGPAGFVANLALVQEYTGHAALLGVSWTLSLEFVWYGIFALVMLTGGERHAFALTLAASAALVALSLVALLLDGRPPLGRFAMLGAAALGYAAFVAADGRLSRRRLWIAFAAFALAVGVSQVVAFGYFSHPKVTLFNGLCGWLGAVAVFWAFQRSAALREARLCRHPLARTFGRISYSVYLTHGPVILIWGAAFGGMLLLGAPMVTFALSLALFAFVERPGIAAGRRVAGWLARPGAVTEVRR